MCRVRAPPELNLSAVTQEKGVVDVPIRRGGRKSPTCGDRIILALVIGRFARISQVSSTCRVQAAAHLEFVFMGMVVCLGGDMNLCCTVSSY